MSPLIELVALAVFLAIAAAIIAVLEMGVRRTTTTRSEAEDARMRRHLDTHYPKRDASP